MNKQFVQEKLGVTNQDLVDAFAGALAQAVRGNRLLHMSIFGKMVPHGHTGRHLTAIVRQNMPQPGAQASTLCLPPTLTFQNKACRDVVQAALAGGCADADLGLVAHATPQASVVMRTNHKALLIYHYKDAQGRQTYELDLERLRAATETEEAVAALVADMQQHPVAVLKSSMYGGSL